VLLYIGFCQSVRVAQLLEKRSQPFLYVASVEDLVIFSGGYNSSGLFIGKVDIYNITSNTVQQKTLSSSPLLTVGCTCDDLFVLACITPNYDTTIEIYNSTSNTWFNLSPPVQSYFVSPGCVGDYLLFVSGKEFPSEVDVPTVNIYNKISKTWLAGYDLVEPKYGAKIATVGTTAFIIGGCKNGTCSVEVFISESNTWGTMEYIEEPASTFHAVVKDQAIVFAYANYAGLTTKMYNVTTNQWSTQNFSINLIDHISSIVCYEYVVNIDFERQGSKARLTYDILGSFAATTQLAAFSPLAHIGDYYFGLNGSIIYYSNGSSDWKQTSHPGFDYGYLARDKLLYAGFLENGNISNTVSIFNLKTATWTTTKLPTAYCVYLFLSTGNTVVLYAGHNSTVNLGLNYTSLDLFAFTVCSSDSDCDDGIFCNGAEICDSNGFCATGADPCNTTCNTQCNEDAKNCYDPQGTSCDNGDYCDGSDTCNGAGLCIHSGNPCVAECKTSCFNQTCGYSAFGLVCGNDDCSLGICNGTGTCVRYSSGSCDEAVKSSTSASGGSSLGIILGSVFGVLFVFIVVVAIVILWMRKRKPVKEPEARNSVELTSYKIDNIKILEKIGSGEFGDVFRGYMDVYFVALVTTHILGINPSRFEIT
jgi:hypothetical protein